YPTGDHVRAAEVWNPPETWAGLSNAALNAALDEIERGVLNEDGQPNGQRYSAASGAKARAAWKVVQKHCPEKSESQCREIVVTWGKNGLVYDEEYEDPKR